MFSASFPSPLNSTNFGIFCVPSKICKHFLSRNEMITNIKNLIHYVMAKENTYSGNNLFITHQFFRLIKEITWIIHPLVTLFTRINEKVIWECNGEVSKKLKIVIVKDLILLNEHFHFFLSSLTHLCDFRHHIKTVSMFLYDVNYQINCLVSICFRKIVLNNMIIRTIVLVTKIIPILFTNDFLHSHCLKVRTKRIHSKVYTVLFSHVTK